MRGLISGSIAVAMLGSVFPVGGVAIASRAVLHTGAIQLGAAGALSSVEGSVTSRVGLRVARHFGAGSSTDPRVLLDARLDHQHVSDIDVVDLGAGVLALHRVGESGTYVEGGVVASLRQEWVGSFSEARYPVGVDLGLLTLLSARAGFDVVYAYRRVLSDPVADYNEHRVSFGISVFFANHEEKP